MDDKKEEGLGLFNLILVGFTFIASITFTFTFSRIVAGPEESGPYLGMNVLWMYIVEGAAALICAWSFAKLVHHHPQTNGGLMQYSRSAFGKFWGLIGGLLNYFSIPLIITTMVISIFRTNFGDGSVVDIVGGAAGFGNWGKLFADCLGIIVFFASASVIYFGVNKYKKFSVFISWTNWIVIGLILILSLVAGFVNLGNGINALEEVAKNTVNINSVGTKKFATFFMSLFFTFAGLETFITSGKTIKNSRKNLPIAMVIIMIAVIIFYIVITVLVMFAVGDGYATGKEYFATNPILPIFERLHSNGVSESTARLIGAIIIIASTVLVRFNSMMSITMFGGALLEPLSKQEFISREMSVKNERAQLPLKAITFTIILLTITLILFLVIPDVVEGVTGKSSPFDFAKLEGITSLILIAIYVISISSCLKLGYDNKIKLNVFELIMFICILGFLGFLIGTFFITSIVDPLKEGGIQNIIGVTLEIVYVIAIIVSALFIYYVVYPKNFKNQTPEQAAELKEYEKNFQVIDPQGISNNWANWMKKTFTKVNNK